MTLPYNRVLKYDARNNCIKYLQVARQVEQAQVEDPASHRSRPQEDPCSSEGGWTVGGIDVVWGNAQ